MFGGGVLLAALMGVLEEEAPDVAVGNHLWICRRRWEIETCGAPLAEPWSNWRDGAMDRAFCRHWPEWQADGLLGSFAAVMY